MGEIIKKIKIKIELTPDLEKKFQFIIRFLLVKIIKKG